MSDKRTPEQLAAALADYIATRTTPRPTDPLTLERETVYETVRLIFTEALPDTLAVLNEITLGNRP